MEDGETDTAYCGGIGLEVDHPLVVDVELWVRVPMIGLATVTEM